MRPVRVYLGFGCLAISISLQHFGGTTPVSSLSYGSWLSASFDRVSRCRSFRRSLLQKTLGFVERSSLLRLGQRQPLLLAILCRPVHTLFNQFHQVEAHHRGVGIGSKARVSYPPGNPHPVARLFLYLAH